MKVKSSVLPFAPLMFPSTSIVIVVPRVLERTPAGAAGFSNVGERARSALQLRSSRASNVIVAVLLS